MFRKLLRPCIAPYEAPLDAVGFVVNGGMAWIIGIMWGAVALMGDKWREMRSGKQSEEVSGVVPLYLV